jgi:hypothetical protein
MCSEIFKQDGDEEFICIGSSSKKARKYDPSSSGTNIVQKRTKTSDTFDPSSNETLVPAGIGQLLILVELKEERLKKSDPDSITGM